jgi:hypothetical protein
MDKVNVYLVRGKNGEYASGTKVCVSSRGAKNTMNKFLDGAIHVAINKRAGGRASFDDPLYQMFTTWCWGRSKPAFCDWSSFERHNDLQIRNGLNVERITRSEYETFMDIVNHISDYWSVEEVEQDA